MKYLNILLVFVVVAVVAELAGWSPTLVFVASGLAMIPLAGIAAQPFWGQVADRTGSRTRVLALIGCAAALGYMGVYLARGFGALLVATALLAFFASALIPICVSVTLALTRDQGPRGFGRARVWGTVGFLVWVVAFPQLLMHLRDGDPEQIGDGG